MRWLDKTIKSTVERAVEDYCDEHLDAAIKRILDNHPRFQFVKVMQMQMLRCDPKMDPREAWNTAALCSNCTKGGAA
jgi:uncharacterized tellurite resistance protein B-like protein